MSEQSYWQRTAGRRLSRRGVLRGSAVAGLGLAGAALIGCGDDDDDEAAPAAQAPAPAAPGSPAPGGAAQPAGEQPTSGGEFTISRRRTPTGHYDPHTALNEQLAFWMYIGDFATLMSPDGTEVIPELFESWEIPGDGTEMIVKIRSNAKWHNRGTEAGRSLDAEDAAFNLLDIGGRLKPDRAAEFHSRLLLAGMSDAEAIDEKTLKVTFEHPVSTFLPGLSHFRAQWASKEFESAGGDWTDAESLVGTGPFTIEEYTPDQRIIFKKNPEHWAEGLPYLDSVVHQIIPDTNSSITAFSQGELDLISGGSRVERETVKKLVPDSVERKWSFISWLHWRYQTQRKPFDDPRVRRALFLVPDYGKMMTEYFGDGYFSPAAIMSAAYPEAYQAEEILKMPGYNPDTKEQDRKDAVDLLTAAGFPDGDINFGVLHYSFGYFSANSIRIQADLLKVWPNMGMELDIAPDTPSFAKRQAQGNFDTISYTIHGLPDMALETISNYGSQEGLSGGRNYGQFTDAKADELMASAVRELDSEARAVILRQFEDRMLELMPTVGIGSDWNVRTFRPEIGGTEQWGGRLASGGRMDSGLTELLWRRDV